MIHSPLDPSAVPHPSSYPAPPDLVQASIHHAVLAVAFHDTCQAGNLPGSTSSLLTNTFLTGLLSGRVLDTSDDPPINPTEN